MEFLKYLFFREKLYIAFILKLLILKNFIIFFILIIIELFEHIELLENNNLRKGFAAQSYVISANGNLIPTSTSFHIIS